MKKLMLFILLMLPIFIYAENDPILISKKSDESYIIKQGDIVTLYLLYNDENENIIDSYNAQFYYNPYVFELVKTDNEFIKLEEGWEIANYNTYSSIINLSVINKTNENTKEILEEKSRILAKMSFRIKENIINQTTYIELLKENTYVKSIDNKEIQTIKNVNNQFLYYEIKDNAIDKLDSHLNALIIKSDDEYEYIEPDFNPGIYEYNFYTHNDEVNVSALCPIINCDVKGIGNYTLKKNKMSIKLNVSASNKEKSTYSITINKLKESQEYPKLKKLKVLKYNIIEEFSSYESTYHVVIPSTENSLLIDYESEYDVIIKGNENLKIGENIISIDVKNDSNETNTYYIIVTKTEKEEDKKVPVVKEVKENDEIIVTNKNKDEISEKEILLAICMIISMCAIACIIILLKRDIDERKERN